MDALGAWGTEDDVRAHLNAHLDTGADQVGIQTLRPDGGTGPDWNILEALAPR